MPKNIVRAESGQAFMLVVLLTPILLGMTGLLIDYGVAAAARTNLQSVADAAALAGAADLPDGSATRSDVLLWARKNGLTDGENTVSVTVTTPYRGDPDKVEVNIVRTVPTHFMRALGLDSMRVSARAVASRPSGVGGTIGYSFLALHPTVCRSFDKSGTGTLQIINGGGIMVDSSCSNGSNGAMNRTGSGTVIATLINFVSGATVTQSGVSGSFNPQPVPVASAVADPLASRQAPNLSAVAMSPDSGGTAAAPSTRNVGGGATLRPGVYYGGINITSGSPVVFQSGVYVMAGGGLSFGGSGSVTANAAFFYNTNDPFAPQGGPGSPARCQVISHTGSGTRTMSPSASGPYKDILFWQDKNCNKTMTAVGSGGSSAGVIYVPGATVNLSGGGSLGAVQMIAQSFDVSGSGTLTVDFRDYVGLTVAGGRVKLVE